MQRFSTLVFDENVRGVVGSTLVYYTSSGFDDLLSQFDELSIQGIADGRVGAPSVSVQIQHSDDARNWVNKNTSPEISQTSIFMDTTVMWGSDPGLRPSMDFVRLAISVTEIVYTNGSFHLKIYVTARDMDR